MKFLPPLVVLCISLNSPGFAAEETSVSNEPAPRKIAMVSKSAAKKAKAAKKHIVNAEALTPILGSDFLASVPTEQIEEGIDNFVKATDNATRLSRRKLDEVVCWLGKLYRQMNEMPAATPAASPYVQNAPLFDAAAKAIWTAEGRIKTVTSR
jgi:hypothetical protein